jgi:U3 small nucleolar RNA-associated protein 19
MWSGSDESISEKPTDKKKKTEKGDSTLLSPATISKRMKLKFTKAWISFLRLPLPIDVYKEVNPFTFPTNHLSGIWIG